jgi:hypothetical protein
MRHALAYVPETQQSMVAAALRRMAERTRDACGNDQPDPRTLSTATVPKFLQ